MQSSGVTQYLFAKGMSKCDGKEEAGGRYGFYLSVGHYSADTETSAREVEKISI